jgi:hypothetical protein
LVANRGAWTASQPTANVTARPVKGQESEGGDGEHIALTVYAASEDDARQTHHENYANETIVAVHQ